MDKKKVWHTVKTFAYCSNEQCRRTTLLVGIANDFEGLLRCRTCGTVFKKGKRWEQQTMNVENAGFGIVGTLFPTTGATPTKAINTKTGALLAYGTSVPADTTAGYEAGCLFLKTNGGVGTSLYVNEGTAASSDFNAK